MVSFLYPGNRWGIYKFKNSLLPLNQGFLAEDFYSWGFHIDLVHNNAYSWEIKIKFLCPNTQKCGFSNLMGWRLDLKFLKSMKFYWSKSSDICNCQIWICHDFYRKWKFFAKDLITKHDHICFGSPWHLKLNTQI